MNWYLMPQQQRIDELTRLYDQGYSQAGAAELFETSRENVGQFSRRHNLISPCKSGGQPGNCNAGIDGLGKTTIKRLTKRVLEKARRNLYVCEKCDKENDTPWPRHHKDRDRSNNDPDNLEVLCHSCHAKEHQKGLDRDTDGKYVSKTYIVGRGGFR